MPVVSCLTSERLEATVAKVSFNKCLFLEGSLSCFLSNTTPLLAELKYLFQLIFSLTLEIIYIPRLNLSLQTWCICRLFFGGFFSFFFLFLVLLLNFVCLLLIFFLLSMETQNLCLKVIYTTQITCIMAHIKEGGGRGIQTVKPGKYHILWLNYM